MSDRSRLNAINEYASCYTNDTLERLTSRSQERIAELKVEREKVGEDWTPVQIVTHQQTIDERIAILEEDISRFQEALKIMEDMIEVLDVEVTSEDSSIYANISYRVPIYDSDYTSKLKVGDF
jgi:hypothetical protein